jgi:hypothetical protein
MGRPIWRSAPRSAPTLPIFSDPRSRRLTQAIYRAF